MLLIRHTDVYAIFNYTAWARGARLVAACNLARHRRGPVRSAVARGRAGG